MTQDFAGAPEARRGGAADRDQGCGTCRRFGAALALPEIVAEAWQSHPVIQEFEAHQALAWEYRENYDAMAPLLRGRLDESKGTMPAAYDEAMALRAARGTALAKVFEDVDVLLTLVGAGRCAQGIGLDRRPPLQPSMDADGRALRQCSHADRGRRIAGGCDRHRSIWRRCEGVGGGAVCGASAQAVMNCSPDERSDIRDGVRFFPDIAALIRATMAECSTSPRCALRCRPAGA